MILSAAVAAQATAAPGPASSTPVRTAIARVPLAFERNVGQAPDEVHHCGSAALPRRSLPPRTFCRDVRVLVDGAPIIEAWRDQP